MKIRKIKKSDYPEIKKLEKELAGFETKLDPDMKENPAEEYFSVFKKNFKKEESLGFVAIENKKIIGFIWSMVENWEALKSKKLGHIKDLVVTKEKRNKGTGKKLLNKMINELKNRGIENVTLWVYKNNPAKALYKKEGFTEYIDIMKLKG